MQSPIGRLAPSPTGALHLGNARSFLLAWISIRSRSGKLILRIEDIDSPRVKVGARQATLDDLRWLGLNWDEGPDVGGPCAPYDQTQRLAIYAEWLDDLKARELVYPCNCSRSEIAAAASAPHETLEGPLYPGTCRGRRVADARVFQPYEFAWRYRTGDQIVTWHDHVVGPKATCPAETLGDFLVAKGDNTPAYQLAVIVDDYVMQVSEVLRGQDLIPSTFRQLDLMKRFQWTAPEYYHVPLMIGADGRRLAKRHGDTRVSWFREAGYAAAQLWGYLAWTAGLLSQPTRIESSELLPLWNPLVLDRAPTVVNLPDVLRVLDRL